jgi:hypothetical protein
MTIVRPTMAGSPPKRCCQMPWLNTTTGAAPSLSSNVRPSSGLSASVVKKLGETTPPRT